MKNFIWVFLIAAFILFPKVIFAGNSNYYFSGTAGIFNPNNLDLNDIETIHSEKIPTGEFTIHTDLKDGEAQLEIGTAVLAAIGYRMGSSRIEIEYGYRNAIFSNVSGRSSNYQQETDERHKGRKDEAETRSRHNGRLKDNILHTDFLSDAVGDLKMHSLMANLYEDFRNKSNFTPYLGGGVGYTFQKYNFNSVASNSVETVWRTTSSGRVEEESEEDVVVKTKTKFRGDLAYQAMAGINYEINDVISANFGYRFFAVHDFINTHSAEVGIRYSF